MGKNKRIDVIDTMNEYVRDLGADIPPATPKERTTYMWKSIVIVVLVLLVGAAIGQLRTAVNSRCQVQMVVKLNNTVIEPGGTYSVHAGDQILITAESSESTINRIGYYSNLNMEIRDIYKNIVTITVPDYPEGTKVQLFIEAIADNDDGTANTITKTGWKKFILVY